jgi:hypothetical protein
MLDYSKRQKIIALVSNGSSRRMAARYVGCSPSTITRAALRDPDFARQLATAEQNAEIDALRALRFAARKDRYWRAAAWLLERKNPEDFAQRPPNLFTSEEVAEMITSIVEVLCDEVPEANCERAIQKLEELIEIQRRELTTSSFPKTPTPELYPPSPEPSTLPLQHPSSEPCEVATSTPATTTDTNGISVVEQ